MTRAPWQYPSSVQQGMALLFGPSFPRLVALLGLVIGLSAAGAAQSPEAALAIVRTAVSAELAAAKADHSAWRYLDHDVQPDRDVVYEVIETPKGDLRRTLLRNGHKLTGSDESTELTRLRDFVSSSDEQARKRRDAEHDDAQARELLTMLPDAFLWNITGESPTEVSLHFHPNPGFNPPDMQARVLSAMAGEMVVARDSHRIRTLRGTLTDDVRIGFGILGRLNKGGLFDVERREVASGHWQITETHVHIGGRAMLFKSIGQQEDETKTEFRPSTAANLQAALEQITR